MIGVIANPADHPVVSEFFEFFKTPWEFYRSDRLYEVLLCTEDGAFDESAAKLIVVYGGNELRSDSERKIEIASRRINRFLSYMGVRIPIYGESVTFRGECPDVPVDEESKAPAVQVHRFYGRTVVRIGYDLFTEVRILLTVGQPASNASMPALDLHVAVLRELIVGSGTSLVEIPPVPDGYKFIACLTHDVDHPAIYSHEFDHTMFGFLYRAIFGSLVNLFRGRILVRTLLTNWVAALKLPFVYLGWAKDFWRDFDDRYLELENRLCSTFFLIPFKNYPGKQGQGLAPGFRAAAYGARDIADSIRKIIAAGCEVGLHGIDAWIDSSSGQEEVEEIRRLTGVTEIGVRMHWLYFDQHSPATLERADAAYDSTIGYNETVGYRSGTTQAYKPLQATRLLELPVHVMDTAMFYPAYLDLSSRQATALVSRMMDNAVRSGGCLTISWHDRSLAPERLWDACYRDLIQELRNRGAWFATAGQAVSWFRKRRSVVFEADCVEPDTLCARVSIEDMGDLPGLRIRTHNPPGTCRIGAHGERFLDMVLDESVDDRVPVQ
jgi:hypothetical protein